MGSHIAISSFSHKIYVITAEEFISKKSTVHENPLAPQTNSKHLKDLLGKGMSLNIVELLLYLGCVGVLVQKQFPCSHLVKGTKQQC